MSALGADPEATPDGEADPEAAPEGGAQPEAMPESAAEPEAMPEGHDEPQATPHGQPPRDDASARPVSKLAIVTLITGILALVPIALVCGIAALAGIRKAGRRGRGMAVAGLFLAGAWVVAGGTAGIAYYFTHGFQPKVHVQYNRDAIFTLRPGECLNGRPNSQDFTLVSCATPHDAEVFATFPLPASAWPGTTVLQQDAGTGCGSRLSGYLNPALASASLTQVYVYPDQQSWSAGVRTVVCEVRANSGQMTGSVRKPG
jgi:Septum formation